MYMPWKKIDRTKLLDISIISLSRLLVQVIIITITFTSKTYRRYKWTHTENMSSAARPVMSQ